MTYAGSRKRVGIIGASGYAGHELIKLLVARKDIELVVLNSKSFAGKRVKDIYPDFDGPETYTGYSIAEINDMHVDIVFLALPHGLSVPIVTELRPATKVVDLGPDYRFHDLVKYQAAYGIGVDGAINQAAYGLPELFRDDIEKSRVVANPGCFATAAILSAFPIQKYASHIIFDCKSGWSGAGRESVYAKDSSVASNNLIAYNLTHHRHKYEIEQFIGPKVSFTPHVLDTYRGLMTTTHILLQDNITQKVLVEIYSDFYRDSPFIKVASSPPDLHAVQGTNLCNIGGFEIDEAGQLVVVATIDNLMKGAAGQAVQNMNLMLGFNEAAGLKQQTSSNNLVTAATS